MVFDCCPWRPLGTCLTDRLLEAKEADGLAKDGELGWQTHIRGEEIRGFFYCQVGDLVDMDEISAEMKQKPVSWFHIKGQGQNGEGGGEKQAIHMPFVPNEKPLE